jgi:ribosomal protein L44E
MVYGLARHGVHTHSVYHAKNAQPEEESEGARKSARKINGLRESASRRRKPAEIRRSGVTARPKL